jgi:hypothetical protein
MQRLNKTELLSEQITFKTEESEQDQMKQEAIRQIFL